VNPGVLIKSQLRFARTGLNVVASIGKMFIGSMGVPVPTDAGSGVGAGGKPVGGSAASDTLRAAQQAIGRRNRADDLGEGLRAEIDEMQKRADEFRRQLAEVTKLPADEQDARTKQIKADVKAYYTSTVSPTLQVYGSQFQHLTDAPADAASPGAGDKTDGTGADTGDGASDPQTQPVPESQPQLRPATDDDPADPNAGDDNDNDAQDVAPPNPQ
jgi:hypothetical protein